MRRSGGGRGSALPFERPNLGTDLRWRPIAWALLRSLLSVALLVTVYFVLPLDRSLDAGGVVLLMVGMLVLAIIVAWQIRTIFQARYPVLQAIEALAIAIPLFLLTFATLYFELARSKDRVFTEPLNKVDSVYFAVTVFATVGFGDIAPVTQTARIVTTLQMLGDLVVLGVLLRSIVGAVRLTRQHRSEVSRTPAGGQPPPRAADSTG